MQRTILTVRVLSCDAKIIGSLVGGCRVTVLHRETGEVLASGRHEGGSGSTALIMDRPHTRGTSRFDDEGTACFQVPLELTEPTPVEIVVEGPLAFSQARQTATTTTWLIPGRDVIGDGVVLELRGFIVEIMTPPSSDTLRGGAPVHLQAAVRLL